MSQDEVFEQVSAVVRDVFHVPEDVPIGPKTTSVDIDGWDSLSHSILLMRVEETFGIELPFDRVYDLADLGALADVVRETKGESV